MNTKHTPTPWKRGTSKYGSPFLIGREDTGFVVAECRNQHHSEEAEANAARIVACVNGCEGIADPSAVKDMMEALKAWRYAYSECTGTDAERIDAKIKACDMTHAAILKATQP